MSEVEQIAGDFDALYDLLDELGAVNSPAELQGMLCGRLCGGASISDAEWLQQVEETLALMESPDESLSAILLAMLEQNKQQLGSDDFSLKLLLPDDEQGIHIRAQALSQWCHGFLSGFGGAGVVASDLTADQKETLQDFADIVQIEVDIESEAGSEADFVGLAEYVRMAAMSVFLELGDKALNQAATPKTLH